MFQKRKLNKNKYKPIQKTRKINAIRHQARLGVLPTNEFVQIKNKANNYKCKVCEALKDIKHIIKAEYDFDNKKWKINKVKRIGKT